MKYILLIAITLVLSMIGLGLACIKKGLSGKTAKKLMGMNVMSLFGVLVVATILMMPSFSMAAENVVATSGDGLRYLAAALSTGLACIGTGIAVAATGSAALGAISEDSSLLGKTLIFVGLAEGIAIYGLIISIMVLPS